MPLYTLYELLIYIFWLSFAKALLLHRDIQPFAEYAVAPLVGAWIETAAKFFRYSNTQVAPLVGAWIETYLLALYKLNHSRTPRGCVD